MFHCKSVRNVLVTASICRGLRRYIQPSFKCRSTTQIVFVAFNLLSTKMLNSQLMIANSTKYKQHNGFEII